MNESFIENVIENLRSLFSGFSQPQEEEFLISKALREVSSAVRTAILAVRERGPESEGAAARAARSAGGG